jgi:hypothetical protein
VPTASAAARASLRSLDFARFIYVVLRLRNVRRAAPLYDRNGQHT